jgi:hypothetical protein
MNRLLIVATLLPVLAACQTIRHLAPRAASPQANPVLTGEYDNHEQVWSGRENATPVVAPHVVVSIQETPSGDWSTWHVRLDAATPLEATWAMHRSAAADGSIVMLPHRATVAAPAQGRNFDAKEWVPLDACALRGDADAGGLHLSANGDACAVLAPGIGAQAALLPLAIERSGEWLRLRLYVDQARGADVREDLRLLQVFGGWAALNGAGQEAAADSNDWHMDRKVHLGSEGGRYPLTFRDGNPSGYSLLLERLTYREGNVPVLKLSVVDDRSGRTLAYAWANPEATRIGLSLGWVQVGLDRAVPPTR